jgi:hypothetical protein
MDPEEVFAGWLRKKNKRRWFLLHNGRLYWFLKVKGNVFVWLRFNVVSLAQEYSMQEVMSAPDKVLKNAKKNVQLMNYDISENQVDQVRVLLARRALC